MNGDKSILISFQSSRAARCASWQSAHWKTVGRESCSGLRRFFAIFIIFFSILAQSELKVKTEQKKKTQ